MEKKRSVGVTAIAWIDIFLPIMPLFGIFLSHSDLAKKAYVGIFLLFLIVLEALGIATLKLKPKARTDNIIVAVIGALVCLGPLWPLFFILALYFIWVIFYLTRPKVKEQFR